MTDDEVFAEFYFTTIVIPTWKSIVGWEQLRDMDFFHKYLGEYYKLPGSRHDRFVKYIESSHPEFTHDVGP